MFGWFKKKNVDSRLPFHTDIHCHLVPCIDDGSKSVESSVELLQHMQQWGITRIIPTPHVTEDTFENTPATIDPAYGALVAGANDSGIEIDILPPSAEYRLDSFFVDQLEVGNVRQLGNSFILVENNFSVEPWGLDNMLYDLSLKGYRPILAHPERYLYYHGNLSRYKQLHDRGIYFQCNILSLSGYYGKNVRNVAMKLIDNDLVDFLGTDLHMMRHVDAIEDYMKTSHFNRVSDRLRGRLMNDTFLEKQ